MKLKSEDGIVMGSEDRPRLRELIDDYRRCSPFESGGWNRQADNDATRYARWPGQSTDGKKHDGHYVAATGKPAFPFDGASDTRILLADEIVNEIGAVLYVAFRRAMVAEKMSLEEENMYALRLLDHLLNRVLFLELLEQVRLATQYQGTYGFFFLHTRWVREVALERRTVRLEELVALLDGLAALREQGGELPEGASGLPDGMMFQGILEDEKLEKECMAFLKAVHGLYAQAEFERSGGKDAVDLPELSAATLRAAVRDLRKEGLATLTAPYVCRDEPEVLCLKPWDEVRISGQATDLRKARIYRRVFLDEVSVRRKIVEEGWDPKWVEAALKHKGRISSWTEPEAGASGGTMDGGERFGPGRSYATYNLVDAESELVEVVYATYWALDRDNVPGVFCTVFHPEVCGEEGEELYADHGLIEEGEIPYVAGRREVTSPQVTSSRSIPEIAVGWQREKKVQRDAVIDLTSMAVIPPINVYAGSMGAKYRFGPAVQNTVQFGREPRFMEVPKGGAPVSNDVMDRVDRDADRYFGRMSENVPPVLTQVQQQVAADAFLVAWTKAFAMVLRLCQRNMADADFAKVTGAPEGWLEQRREAKGLFGAVLEFDVRELDPEYVIKQLEAINKMVLPGDTTGAVNRRLLTKMQLHAINPRLARELIVDETSASQAMFDQVNQDIALMFLGNMPRLVENDGAAGMKLQFARQIVTANPEYLRALEEQPEGRFAQLLQLYAKNLGFSVQQEANKQIGRIGVDPEAGNVAAGGAEY